MITAKDIKIEWIPPDPKNGVHHWTARASLVIVQSIMVDTHEMSRGSPQIRKYVEALLEETILRRLYGDIKKRLAALRDQILRAGFLRWAEAKDFYEIDEAFKMVL